jgi:ornithine cyclodeaminase/alanine dehydrogenase-like protein (mu-crystallin family)
MLKLYWESILIGLPGSLTLMNPDGVAFGFLNAEELTAYRTALASSLLMLRRSKVHTITVFGAGKQAYWHVRLALMLHGKTIHNVHIHVYRFTESTRDFFKGMRASSPYSHASEYRAVFSL